MPQPRLFQRFCADRVSMALEDTPVVMVVGPRQCGKTTLVKELLSGRRTYLTLDDATTQAAATSDPTGFVRSLDLATIDEIQRAPDLLRAIKQAVDHDRRPGRFLLTGSANILVLPQVSESLAGRMEPITLMPLSAAEMIGARPTFLGKAFAGEIPTTQHPSVGRDLVRAVLTGGYPEMVRRHSFARRQAWVRAYVDAIVRRDVRDIADVERLDRMPRLLRALGIHSSQLINFTQLGGQIGFDDKTTRKYVGILEQLFLVQRIDPWFHNRMNRLIKTPKLHFLDSGLLAAVTGVTEARISTDRSVFGPVLETFVVSEILKQTTFSSDVYALYHYRDKDQNEVDIVIENGAGELVGIEVKAAATVVGADFNGLRKLANISGKRFKLGAVVYDGETLAPFGDRLFAAPISILWG